MADAATISVLLTARDQASAQLKKVEGNMGRLAESFAKHRRGIGMAATAIGAAITGIAVLSVKSSLDQEIGIRTLDQAMKRVGTSYDSNKEKIEALISAQQNKTNFGDEEQRKALEKLITIGGTYDGSLTALTVTTDLAAGANMSLEGAALLVAKAIAGETSSLSRYGIVIEKGASQTEIMAALTKQFGGSAEAAADPIVQLKNRLGDLMQVFGDMLLPVLETLLPKIELFIRDIIAWAEEHPTLTKVIGLTAAALGGVLAIVGPLLLLLPTLVAGFGLLSVAMGPVTIALVGIAAAVTAGIIIWRNWDKVVGSVKKLLADSAKEWINYARMILVAAKAVADFLPGLKGTEDRLQSGIDALDSASRSLDDWSGVTQDSTRKSAEAWGALEDEQMHSAQAIIENSEQLSGAHETMSHRVGESVKDIDMSYGAFEDSVARAQGIVIESLDSIIAKQESLEMSQDDSLARIRNNLDETTIKWRESSLRMEDVVSRWAESTGQSVGEVLDHWDDINLDLNDLKKVFALFTEATGQDIFTWEGKVKSATDTVSSNFRSVESNMTLIASGIHQTLVGTASETLRIAKGIHDTIAGIHRDASRPVPAPRVGGFSGGGGGFPSGIHVTDPGFNAATVVANQALAPLKGTGGSLAGFAPGTTFAQIEAALGLANGGIVRRPTLAMLGERGPEAVVPLGKGGGMGTVNNFHFHGAVYGIEDLKEAVVEAVRDHAISGGFAGVFAEA